MSTIQPASSLNNLYNSFNSFKKSTYDYFLDTGKKLPSMASSSYDSVSSFMSSNRVVDRIIFIFMLVILIVIIVNFSISMMAKPMQIKDDVLLLNGYTSADQPITIVQNAVTTPELFITPSQNLPGGLEFSWSVWLYINELNQVGAYSNVFFKGPAGVVCDNMNNMLNAPGMYLKPDTIKNTISLCVVMDTFTKPGAYLDTSTNVCNISNNILTIPYIPLREWVHACIVCQDRNMDVYINGTISASILLDGIPKQNNGDVCVGQNRGFNGRISTLRYITRKLGALDILGIFKQGPINKDITPIQQQSNKVGFWDYLSFRWFSQHN